MTSTNRIDMIFIVMWFISNITFSCHAQANDSQELQPPQGPRIFFTESTWNFDTVNQGEKISHQFTMQNIGSTDLVIDSVRSSCGCTTVKPTKNTLAPGETIILEATFDSSGRDGEQLKKIYVTTNDPTNTIAELSITGTIRILPGPRISYHPTSWDFGLQEQNATPNKKIIIKNEGQDPLELTDIKTSNLCTTALDPEGPILPGKKATLNIGLQPLKTPGILETYVNIRTNDTTKPNIPFRIFGYVKGVLPPSILLTPTQWDFGIVYKDNFTKPEINFYVRNAGGEDLVVERMKIPYGFETESEFPITIAPNGEQKIMLRMTNPFQLGTVRQYVFIYTNDPVHSARRINVYGYIAEKDNE